MSNIPAMSLGDIKRATTSAPVSPYDDLQKIIGACFESLRAYFPLAGKAHSMGLTAEDPITVMSSYMVRDMETFKGRIESVANRIPVNISPTTALAVGNELLSIQEDMGTVLEPLAKDLLTMYSDRGIVL